MGTISTRLGSLSLASLPRILFGGTLGTARAGQVGAFEALIQRAVQRRQLGELDEHLLQDIGVSKAEAYRESLKAFWLK